MYEDYDKVRKALEAPIDEREDLDLPKLPPVEQLERARFKPLPPHGKKKTVPR